jgi:hypothetical protein
MRIAIGVLLGLLVAAIILASTATDSRSASDVVSFATLSRSDLQVQAYFHPYALPFYHFEVPVTTSMAWQNRLQLYKRLFVAQ